MRYLSLLLFLSACTAVGPLYDASKMSKSGAIILYRPMMYLGNGAGLYDVELDGKTTCRLHPGSFWVITPKGGDVTISSSIWSDPGTSKISVKTDDKRVRYVKMLPNNDKQIIGVTAGLIGLLVAEGVSESSGPFLFAEIEREQAEIELATLKQDCI